MAKNKSITFKSFDEYAKYYSIKKDEKNSSKSKYYQMGVEAAKMASERAIKQINLNP